jgi:hypothetical protein
VKIRIIAMIVVKTAMVTSARTTAPVPSPKLMAAQTNDMCRNRKKNVPTNSTAKARQASAETNSYTPVDDASHERAVDIRSISARPFLRAGVIVHSPTRARTH